MFLEFLKVSKSQKHFFLKLRCPKNELNIWQKSAQLHRAEFCLIICSFFWQLSFKKNSFWDLLAFNCKFEDKRWLCFSMSDSHSENEKKNVWEWDNNIEFSDFSNSSKDLSFFNSRVFFFFLNDPWRLLQTILLTVATPRHRKTCWNVWNVSVK